MNIPDYHEGALVSIFNLDGTVEVSIGGVELGQGIRTRRRHGARARLQVMSLALIGLAP